MRGLHRSLRVPATCALIAVLAAPTALGSDLRRESADTGRVAPVAAGRAAAVAAAAGASPTLTAWIAALPAARPATPATEEGTLHRLLASELASPTAIFVAAAQSLLSAIESPLPRWTATTRVQLYNVNSRETLAIDVGPDGAVDPATARAVRRFMRCRRTGKRHRMHPQVLHILAEVQRRFPGHTIEIVSGYRSPPYGVKNSKHFHGRAVDLRVRGVRIEVVRDFLWRTHDHVGVGYYRGQNFVHVDWRPGYKKMAWTSPRRGAAYRYHPKWSRL